MKQLSITDVRTALYDMLVRGIEYLSDAELFKADFQFDLNMDEQKVLLLTENLQRAHRIYLPPQVLQALENGNTVKTFLEAANCLLQDLDEE